MHALAGEIGERNVFRSEGLEAARRHLEARLGGTDLEPVRQSFRALGVPCHNLEVEIPGRTRAGEVVVVGAHYDTVPDSPGANDNGSGVAAVLALAREFSDREPADRTVRFVLFVNEEPPFFGTEEMGSRAYARRSARRGEQIRGMLSLETIGYYDDEPGSQAYPAAPLRWCYPDTGDFIAFVANLRSSLLLRKAMRAYRKGAEVPARGAALPAVVPGVGWSDHWSFWREGFPALMVTDTAPYRYPHYHLPSDTPDKLDYGRMAEVVRGLERVVEALASG